MIHGLERVGIIDDISRIITGLGGGSLFLTYTIIVWASVVISAFVDNIPYTATMLPVMGGVAASLGVNQAVLCFGLLTGATLGGNLTPVGASANIAACGILRREGYEVSTSSIHAYRRTLYPGSGADRAMCWCGCSTPDCKRKAKGELFGSPFS